VESVSLILAQRDWDDFYSYREEGLFAIIAKKAKG